MRVLMFGWEFPPHISGGLGTACYGLTKGLYNVGVDDIIFVVPKAYGDEDTSKVNLIDAGEVETSERIVDYSTFFKNIKFIEVGSALRAYSTPEEYEKLTEQEEAQTKYMVQSSFSGKLSFSGGYGQNLFQEIANYAVVASRIAYKERFDIIHAHDWLAYPAGIAAKMVSGKPLIVHVHATDFDRSGGNVNPGVYDIEKNGMEMADKVIAVSNLTRNIIIEKYGINPEKVITVHNAVEPLEDRELLKLRRSINDKIVTFLGRVTLQKGPEYFIEAAHLVLQKMKNVRFVMAGSGDMLHRMIWRVAALKIGDRFHFTGFLKGDDVYHMFSLSDVYVMPSISEPFGISPLEAMQSNVPVIISRQSGVSEILQHAIKVDFWDTHAMADAIYGILKYEGLRNMFNKNARLEVDNLKWEHAAQKVKEIYLSLLN
ncbi:MAG TPA: glycosyltransferase family 4 protein [Bacteroidales bacterium]|jgi:glycosyltransferase involved in cell wall biosynthesis|nr:glycosyltransferase family 4 protein [Bacteroidales bacterium]